MKKYIKMLVLGAGIFLGLASVAHAQYYDSNYYYNGSGSLSFSQPNITLTPGQIAGISVYGSSGTFYVSSNSNSNVATVSISANQVNVTAQNPGSSKIRICSTNNGCGDLYITVRNTTNYYYYNNNYNNNNYYPNNNYSYNNNYNYNSGSNYGNYNSYSNYNSSCSNYYYCNTRRVSLSQQSVSLNAGESRSITISGGSNDYYLSANSSIADVNMYGNTISLHANFPGSATYTICSVSSRSCANLGVTVSGYYNNYNNYYSNYSNGYYYNNGYMNQY
jgi:hypothetical protein